MQTIRNIEFLYGVKNFILDTLCGALLLAVHFLMYRSVAKERGDLRNIVVRCVTFCVRGLVIFAFIWGAMAVKYWVYPYSCLKTTDMSISEERHYEASEEPFDSIKHTKKTITRIDQGFFKPVYQLTTHEIYDKETLVLQYSTIGEKTSFEKRTVDDINFFLYEEMTICFVYNGESIAIHAEDEVKLSYDALTKLYKDFIKENRWNFFVQGAKYLLEEDRDFIEPYLVRYAAGDFTDEEAQTLNEMSIYQTYIQDVSKELIED